MTFVLLVAALVGWWAWKTRQLKALRFGDVAAAVAAITAVALLRKHETVPAILALGGAGWWLWFRRKGGGTETGTEAMPEVEARRVLGVSPTADAIEIRAAHRRLLERIHPDRGGSDALTAEINRARDILLDRGRR